VVKQELLLFIPFLHITTWTPPISSFFIRPVQSLMDGDVHE
jgi:hypothetical protein